MPALVKVKYPNALPPFVKIVTNHDEASVVVQPTSEKNIGRYTVILVAYKVDKYEPTNTIQSDHTLSIEIIGDLTKPQETQTTESNDSMNPEEQRQQQIQK